MDQEDFGEDPFSSHSLWRISRFTLQSLQPLEPLPWNEELPSLAGGFFKSPLNLLDDEPSKFHRLDVLGTDFFRSDDLLESITNASSDDYLDANNQDGESELEDIWSLESLHNNFNAKTPIKSWENSQDRLHREPLSAYFSESGAKGFDAALAYRAADKGSKDAGRVARTEVFLQALFRLGLGWSSMFFRYNGQQRKFEKVLNDIRISGVSLTVVNSLTEEMLQCGTDMQRVRNFIRSTPAKSNQLSARSTFSSTAAVVIYTLEKQLFEYYRITVSLLQIKTLFQQCSELVGALSNMVEAVEEAASEAQVISAIIEKAAHFSQKFGRMENLFREIASRVMEPWLSYVESWVGLGPGTQTVAEMVKSGRGFVSLDYNEGSRNPKSSKPAMVDYRYLPDQMPSFIPADQAQLMFESGRTLRLLTRSHPQHPIVNDRILRKSDTPRLHCAGTWSEIERIQKKAQEYEARLRAEILKYNCGEVSGQSMETAPVSQGSCQNEEHGILSDTFEIFDIHDGQNVTGLLANHSSLENDKLGNLLDETRSPNVDLAEYRKINLGPELMSSLYLSLAPLLSSQALLIDFSSLHLLFKEHKVRSHLTLQWRFQLLGDGFFTSRLSHSLFDPEMESGERKSGVVRSGVHTGLRLGSRDTWPPASSELRLVLIGLLGECNVDEKLENPSNTEFLKERELPGGLSFAIRELTDEEIVKCKDPNAIEALDFLRLQYKPSAVLEAIITQRSLSQYDRLFKHLLRLIRMVSVVSGLIRDSTARSSLSGDIRNVFQRFRIDCQHFVLAVSDYCFHIGVGSTWQRFQDTLSRIERCLDRGDIDGTIEAAHSVSRLRAYHEDVLDQILFALFLSKRHSGAAKLLENIFGTILTFAPLSRMDGMSGIRHESEATVDQLYTTFRKQTSAFVNYLRSLDGTKAASKSFSRSSAAFISRAAPTSVFDHLLARLDMKKYY